MRGRATTKLDRLTGTLTTSMLVQPQCGRSDQPHTKWTKRRGLDIPERPPVGESQPTNSTNT